ncbi:hypothetical protein [Candidatus Nephthysia bennettiae]|uniref:Uncharacterized protein n=1 Tax=Candidatus Nephthysia bennettiae TaxID=3127016 RepID=A0A934K958_9BACT|nr:hypothetical protein [Candidatus Dormibacteraeota bacterium]MBJ7611597.1 hypothetical protein [Candidatus Dormibacteraeota bacterium]
MSETEWVLRQLRDSLSTLAASSHHQSEHIRQLGDVSVDELGLELDDIAPAALAITGPGELTSDQREALAALDAQLARMSGSEHSELWTVEALDSAVEWRRVRELAQEALRRLDNQASPP